MAYTVTDVQMMSKPDPDSPLIASLKRKPFVRVIGDNWRWAEIEIEDGSHGYAMWSQISAENPDVTEAIKKVSHKTAISENIIRSIVQLFLNEVNHASEENTVPVAIPANVRHEPYGTE